MQPVKTIAKRILPSGWLRRWRAARRQRLLDQYPRRVVRHSYHGFPLQVTIADRLGESWYDCEWETLGELALLRQGRLREGARVFDLGAHQGVVALILARIVGPGGHVLAVEAEPHTAALAEENRALNGVEQITVLQAAVAAECGVLSFGLDGQVSNPQSERDRSLPRVEVEALTVDALADRYGVPDVLFIDVEGYETEALRGAKRVLRTHPDCFVEVHAGTHLRHFGSDPAKILEFFPEEHYLLFTTFARKPFRLFEREADLKAEARYVQRNTHLVALRREGMEQLPVSL